MRRTFLAIGVLLFAALPALAQEGKLGYVDSQKIFAQSPDYQEAQSKFDKEVEDWNAQAATMNDEVEKMKEDQQKNSLVWSQTKKKEAEAAAAARQQNVFSDFGIQHARFIPHRRNCGKEFQALRFTQIV